MGFIIKKKEEPKKATISKDELFEKFMLEIGQYSLDEFWNLALTWPLIPSKELWDRFKTWLSKYD